MIHPENLWKLNTNSQSTSTKTCEFSEVNVRKQVNSHSFNKLISLFLPDIQTPQPEIEQIFQTSGFYYANNLKLDEFINRVFIEAFIKRGRFYCLSVGRSVETDDCVAVTPCGNLILSLNKETYQAIGLDGGVLQKNLKRLSSKYFLKLDLKSPDLLPNTKYFENVKKSLQHELLSNFSFNFRWSPEQEDICSSSVAKFFSEKNYTLKFCQNKFDWYQEYSLKLPKIESISKIDGIEEIAEFIGVHTLRCDLDLENVEEAWQTDFEFEDVGSARILNWKGFFSCEEILRLVEGLRKFLNDHPGIPWISLYIHGFEDVPINFFLNPHKYYINGDNSYLMIFRPNDENFLTHQITNSNKMMK